MQAGNYNINNGSCYCVTLNVVDWVDIFIRPVYKNVIVDSLNLFVEKKGLIIHAWCLMSNHLHLVARTREDFQWPYILRDFKRYTTKEILSELDNEIEPDCRRKWMMQRFESPVNVTRQLAKYHFWQDNNHPELCPGSDPGAIQQKILYIHQNPVRVVLVDQPESYIYSSARDYKGKRGLVKIEPFKVLHNKK